MSIVIFYFDGMISRHPYNTETFLMIANNQHIIYSIRIENRPLFDGE